jgi:hypothetical protein
MGNWFEEEAQKLISRAEAKTGIPLEEFYRGLRSARDMIDERLEAAADELDEDTAAEILGS